MKDENHYPLEGGSYRVIDGHLVREDDAKPKEQPEAGSATAALADEPFPRRRKTTED